MAVSAHLDGVNVTKITKSHGGEVYSGFVSFGMQVGNSQFGYQVSFDNKPDIAKAASEAVLELQNVLMALSGQVGTLDPLR